MLNLQNLNVSSYSLGELTTAIDHEKGRRSTEEKLSDGAETARSRCIRLVDFVKEAWPIVEPAMPYVPGRAIEFICRHLEAITWGTFLEMGLPNRLLINVPPRMMKSLLVSVLWPAWEWGPAGMPGLRYLSTSFSDENVRRDCRKMRDLVNSTWFQTLWPRKFTRFAEMDFAIEEGGARQGRAFGSLTGGGGERLIVDDPHSVDTAESEADRRHAIRIFRESVPSRINDPATSAIIIIMQRLHEHDVSGAALALKLGYVHVMLPMEFEPDRKCVTPLGEDWRTKPGELLFPERFSEKALALLKVPLGSYGVAGQFQQRPAPRGGLMFKRHWFPMVKAAPVSGIAWARGWDLAATKTNRENASSIGPAYTAGVKLGRDFMGRYYIGHVVRDQVDGNGVRNMILNTARMDGQACIQDLPQDPGQAGKVQVQDLIAMLSGFQAFGSPEQDDKIGRAQPVAAQAEAGNISVVEGPWNDAFFGELELFPTGAYKDQVDALSRAFARHVRGGRVPFTALPIMITEQRRYFGEPNDG